MVPMADLDGIDVGAASVGSGSMRAPTIGDRLGAHVIDGLLGKGGMGRVFSARRADGSSVAIKYFACGDPTLLFRFKREFRALADVRHDNLIVLGELTVLGDGQAYFTMERIVGRSFVDWVRRGLNPGTPPNLARLRLAMRQLVLGTAHLHRSGFVHRDLKPSNVLVTQEGRVVVLDFGLIREFACDGQTWTRDGQTLGSPHYMAPEQVGDAEVGPAADWYAVGVMLFECLTGTRPFVGAPVEVLMAKLDDAVASPADSLVDLPEPLIDLCRRALDRDPDVRPSADELLAAFGERPTRALPFSARPRFVGRDRELAELRAALGEMRTGQTISVMIRGAEGLGKTALVEHFLDALDPAGMHVVLRSRCHERESVPYKGVDGLVDALSLHLRHLSDLDVAALQPRHIDPLARLFPVLADLWVRRGRPATQDDPREVRRLGTAALREVLTRLADAGPLIAWIDDFQWADADSVVLLDQLLRPPDSPTLLLIVCSRGAGLDDASQWLRTQERVGRPIHDISLSPLPAAISHVLAGNLLPQAETAMVQALIDQARGSPLALVQLARPGLDIDRPDPRLVRRVLGLDPCDRRLFAALALAGRPLPQVVLAERWSNAERTLARLAELEIVALAESNATIANERVAEFVIADLSNDELRELHGQVGELLVRAGVEAEALVDHFEHAGQLERAARLASAAAEQAALALAFDRAATRYRRALDLTPTTTPIAEIDAIRRQLAEQLVHLGRTPEAARLLLDVATRMPAELAHVLRGRAARLLVFGRRVDEALPLLGEQLAAVGERMPTHKLGLLAMTLWNRAIVALRGHRFELRPPEAIDPRQIDRLETLQTVAMALAVSGHMSRAAPLVFALRSRALRLALAAGDTHCLASILSIEAVLCAAIGNAARADALIAEGKRLADSLAIPELECEVEYMQTGVDWLSFRWPAAAERLTRLALRIDDTSSGGAWMRAQVLRSLVHVRLLCGDIAEIRRRAAGERETLREIGNSVELVEYGLKAAHVHLYEGDMAAAKHMLASSRHEFDSGTYTYQRVSIARFEVEIALFDGDIARAYAKVEATIAEARHHALYRTRIVELQLEELRGRCLLLGLIANPGNRRLRRRLRRTIRSLAASKLPMFEALAASAEAVAHEFEGRLDRAGKARRRALEGYMRAGMRMHRAAAELRLAASIRDPALAARAHEYFDSEGITGWRRVVEVHAPSFLPIEPRSAAREHCREPA